MTQIIKIFIVALFLGLFLFSNQALAQQQMVRGLVPCGRRADDASTTVDESAPCSLCHFFILIDVVVDFALFKLAPPLALLMLIIGGGMFMLSAGNPQTVTTGKKIIESVLIGIVIIYGAYLFIGLFLQSIGLAAWTTDIYHTWWDNGMFNIDCEVPMTP